MTDRFSGVMAPLTTPFDEQGKIDFSAIELNLKSYENTCLTGVLALGTTGESVHLSDTESLDVVKAVSDSVPKGVQFLVGVSYPSVIQGLKFIQKIDNLRIEALLVSVPSYYRSRMGESALFSYFESLADGSPFPLLLYNIPKFSGIELSPGLVSELADNPNIVGMKDSSGNLIYLQNVLIKTRDKDFQILSGSAETFGMSLRLGVRGGILAVSCAVPELAGGVFDARESSNEVWRSAQAKLFGVSGVVVGKLSVPGVKYAMDLKGRKGGYCRLPLKPLTAGERAEVEAVLNEYST